MTITSPLTKPINSHFPSKLVVNSKAQIQQMLLKRYCASRVEFSPKDNRILTTTTTKKLMGLLSKHAVALKNPPIKQLVKNTSAVKNIRFLQTKPEEVAKYITQVTKRFSKLEHFAIIDDTDSFMPIRLKKKVYPMRNLRTFIYDHEFCKEVLKCATYVNTMKIRKICIDFNKLKRFQNLQNIYVILKTKYLTLPEEDQNFTNELGTTLMKLPLIQKVVLEQEIDMENQPFLFLGLKKILGDKAKVDLVVDFADVSSHGHRENTIEKAFQTINNSGVDSIHINYVGASNVLKRFGRNVYAPIHVRKELYLRFIKAIMNITLKPVKFNPIVHSSYIDDNLKDGLVELTKSNMNLRISGMTIIYALDVIEFSSLDLLLDLYNYAIPSYELVILNTTHLTRGVSEMLESHYSAVLTKMQRLRSNFSLQITARNLCTLATLLQLITSKGDLYLLTKLKVQIIEPIANGNLKNIFKVLNKSLVFEVIKKLEIDFGQRESPDSEQIIELLTAIAQASPKLRRLTLLYHNETENYELLNDVMEKIRSQYFRIDFEYELDEEKPSFD